MKVVKVLIGCCVVLFYVLFVGTAHAACMHTVITTLTDPNKYNNAWNVSTKRVMTDHTHRCNINTRMCLSTPGNMLCNGVWKSCKTLFVPTVGNSGQCSCGCVQ